VILLQQPQPRRTSARLSTASAASSSTKRPRLSAPPTPSPPPEPEQLTPPPTPVLSHKSLPVQRPPSPPPAAPSRRVLTSRYQHFTSPLCPRPLSPMSVPHLNPKCRRQTPFRASSPPHHSGRWNGSLLHWTLQKNHCLAVRQRQYLASLQTSPSSSYTQLQIYPYAPSNSSSSPSSEDSDSDSSDDEDGEWGEGWDEGECESTTASEEEPESNWRIVVPSQHHLSPLDTSMRIPRACTPPNSPEKMDMDEDFGEESEESRPPVVIKEGVTTILLT
jgi:hypothetical protein